LLCFDHFNYSKQSYHLDTVHIYIYQYTCTSIIQGGDGRVIRVGVVS
jgi:hypothetical protein